MESKPITPITHQQLQGLINERSERRDTDEQALYTLRRILRSVAPFARPDTMGGEIAHEVVHAVDQVEKLRASNADLLEAIQTLVRRIERDNLHTTHGVKLADAKAAISKAS